MKTVFAAIVLGALVAVISGPVWAGGQSDAKELTGAELRTLIGNMGLETKDLVTEPGKEKVEFKIERDGYNVFMAAEVSPSKRYIWLTTYLGSVSELPDFNERAPKILAANSKVQPSQFYTTEKGALMMAIAVDNRNVDPVTLRFRMDKLSQDVTSNVNLWKK